MRKHLIVLIFVMVASGSAQAACLDLPDKLLMYTNKGTSVHIVDLRQTSVALITLDCTLSSEEWRKLALPLHICTDAAIPNPGGGQCKVTKLMPLTGPGPNPASFEAITRRNLSK